MKNPHRLLLAGSIAALLAPGFVAPAAGFEVPRYVFSFDQLPQAQAEGYEDEKPLLFLYADPKKKPT